MPRANTTNRGYTRRNARVDANQKEIIKGLEKIPGVTVVPIGKPLDLLVGYNGITHIFEIKNPDGKDRVNDDQAEFIKNWTGRTPVVCRTLEDCLDALGLRNVSMMVYRTLA